MPIYCVNKNPQSNGDYEVHDISSTKDCHPASANQYHLDYHPNCSSAVGKANATGYAPANGCAYCAPDCHTT
jgi:hypothetical protein